MLSTMIAFRELVKIAPYDGNETGGIVYKSDADYQILPIPSLRPSEDTYIIGVKKFHALRRKMGNNFCGVIHTHPNGPAGASDRDIAIAIKNTKHVRYVWHPRSGTLTQYNGISSTSHHVNVPLWFRIASLILFY